MMSRSSDQVFRSVASSRPAHDKGDLPKAIALVGTNASGKSKLGIELAQIVGGEIISADSRQVYKGFDLCSGKVSPDELARVKHHLVDVVEPPARFTLNDYLILAKRALVEVAQHQRVPILLGGTPLYAEALISGYSLVKVPPLPQEREMLEAKTTEELVQEIEALYPGEAARVGPTNRRRLVRAIERGRRGISYADAHKNEPTHEWMILGITWPMPILEARIKRRLDERLNAGMLKEVENALESGVPRQFIWDLGLEYRFALRQVEGDFGDFEEFTTSLQRSIRRFAKRQLSWFSRWPDIQWISGSEHTRLSSIVNRARDWLGDASAFG